MGLGRMIWRSTVIGGIIDTVKNIKEEHSISDGIKKTAREYLEDDPIYQVGKCDGKIEGYVKTSDEYEEKLLKQADEFLKQKQIFESERCGYEALLDEYEAEIDALSEKIDRTEAENEYLQQLLLRERKLRRMSG